MFMLSVVIFLVYICYMYVICPRKAGQQAPARWPGTKCRWGNRGKLAMTGMRRATVCVRFLIVLEEALFTRMATRQRDDILPPEGVRATLSV